MVQYILNMGLRKFGRKGENDVPKELAKLHIMDTWMPMEVSKLTQEQQMRVL